LSCEMLELRSAWEVAIETKIEGQRMGLVKDFSFVIDGNVGVGIGGVALADALENNFFGAGKLDGEKSGFMSF